MFADAIAFHASSISINFLIPFNLRILFIKASMMMIVVTGNKSCVFDVIQLKDNEAFMQQIQFLVGVQQVVVLTATIVRFKHVQEIVNVKILFPDVLLFKLSAVIILDKLVERVEAGRYRTVFAYQVDIGTYRIG